MTRFIITTTILTCGLIAGMSQDVSAQCHSGSRQPGYGYDYGRGVEYGYGQARIGCENDPHYRYFVLLKRRPDLAAQHAELAAQLNVKFGRFFNASEMITVNGQIAGGATVVTKDAGVSVSPAVATTGTVNAAPAVAAPTAPGAPAIETTESAPATPAGPTVAAPAVETAPVAPAADAAVAPPAAAVTPAVTPPAASDTAAPEHPADLPAPLAAAQAATAQVSVASPGTVSDELKPILGLWRNVIKNSDGSEQVTEVELVENGNAKVTVDAGLLGKRTINGQFAVEDGNFNLKEGDNSVTLGKVVSADKDQVVLKRGDLTLNFTRP